MVQGDVILKFLDDNTDDCILLSDLYYTSDKFRIHVKKGMTTDGASIPRILWTAIGSPFIGKYRKASIIHDALYRSHALSKKDSDRVFLDIMKSLGVGTIKRYLIFGGVFTFGWFSYANKSKSEIEDLSQFIEVEIF